MAALERALAPVGRHMLIGGVAVIARGVRRLTDDVDATLWAEGVDLDDLVGRLARQGLVLRIDDGLAFARKHQVLLLRHEPSGTDVDLSLAWLPFEDEALDRADSVKLGLRRVPIATASDLIVYKAIAARERDRSDIERLLEIHGSTIDLVRIRRTVRELAGVLEQPELVEDLERIVRAVRGSARGSKRARRPQKSRTKRQ